MSLSPRTFHPWDLNPWSQILHRSGSWTVFTHFLFSPLVHFKEQHPEPFSLPIDCWNLQVVPSLAFHFHLRIKAFNTITSAPSCRLTVSQAPALPCVLPSKETPGGSRWRAWTPQESPVSCHPWSGSEAERDHYKQLVVPTISSKGVVPAPGDLRSILMHWRILFCGEHSALFHSTVCL